MSTTTHNPKPHDPGSWQSTNPVGGSTVPLSPASNLFDAANRIEGALADAVTAETDAHVQWTECGVRHDGIHAILYAAFQKETGRVAGLELALRLIRGQG